MLKKNNVYMKEWDLGLVFTFCFLYLQEDAAYHHRVFLFSVDLWLRPS